MFSSPPRPIDNPAMCSFGSVLFWVCPWEVSCPILFWLKLLPCETTVIPDFESIPTQDAVFPFLTVHADVRYGLSVHAAAAAAVAVTIPARHDPDFVLVALYGAV